MTKGNILVSGGAGYIGSHAVLALIDAGWTPVVYDNLSTGFGWAVPDAVPLIEGDIADGDTLCAVMHDHAIMGVMHFAGSIIVPESISEPLKYYANNTANSRTLIEAAVASGVRHFIFSSTAATYGTPDKVVIDEATPQVPINPYGASKLMTEWMLRDVAAAHDFNYGALRYFNVAGADPDARTGQSTAGATHLIKVAVEAALGKRDHVTIFGSDFDTDDGTGVRDYIHVSDLAAAHVLALQALVDDPATSLTFNCGYGRGYSVVEVLDAVDRVTNLKIAREWADRRPGDPAALVADSRAIQARL
ncbi:MAG: UDP-glucose 4-epimerase GalE, partial [Pseudomonadota bacterium]